jgi:hypothetical protein
LEGPILALDEIRENCESVSIEFFKLGTRSVGLLEEFLDVGCDVEMLHYSELTWSNFRDSRGRALPHIGPFRFDFDQVLKDLRQARDAYRASYQPLNKE